MEERQRGGIDMSSVTYKSTLGGGRQRADRLDGVCALGQGTDDGPAMRGRLDHIGQVSHGDSADGHNR